MNARFRNITVGLPATILIHATILLACLFAAPLFVLAQAADPCAGYQAWQSQTNPRTDAIGDRNVAYPETNATYWSTVLIQPIGTTVTLRGQFPASRYMSFQIYDSHGAILDAINDVSIKPDAGQNNPFRGGIARGTYTVRIVFGRKLATMLGNTMATAGETGVVLIYRVYYPNNPDDLTGSTNPALPALSIDGVPLSSCPPRPIIAPEATTVWGRLSRTDFAGSKPSVPLLTGMNPQWNLLMGNPDSTLFPYPNKDNNYMWTLLDRDFLKEPYSFDFAVVRMKAPSVADTQNGMPPYAPAQVRYWSLCTDDPISTAVIRCVADNQATNVNGFVTFVISDPSKRPAAAILQQWGATWIPWGAMRAEDSVYNINGRQLTNADGVFYYNHLLYRQTLADPIFAESIANVSQLRPTQWKQAMGDYWPAIGYCSRAQFEARGADCMGQ